jgi:hypothetical protein
LGTPSPEVETFCPPIFESLSVSPTTFRQRNVFATSPENTRSAAGLEDGVQELPVEGRTFHKPPIVRPRISKCWVPFISNRATVTPVATKTTRNEEPALPGSYVVV